MPAGMTLSKLNSLNPSRLITSCLLAKKRATITPTKPPSPKMRPVLRLFLFLFVNPFSFETGISRTSSSISETRSPGLGDGEGVCRSALPMRRRRADIALVAPTDIGFVPWIRDGSDFVSTWPFVGCLLKINCYFHMSNFALTYLACRPTLNQKPRGRPEPKQIYTVKNPRPTSAMYHKFPA